MKNLLRRVKRKSRQWLAAFLYRSAVLDGLLRFRYRGSIFVLMYHRVLENPEHLKDRPQPGLFVRRQTFRMHMAYLRKRFNLLSLSEFTEIMKKGRRAPERAVLVTFDDGWQDNYANAFPILKEFGIPAVVFLTAGFIGRRRDFWQDRVIRLCMILRQAAKEDKELARKRIESAQLDEMLSVIESRDEELLQIAISGLLAKLKKYPISEIERLVDNLCLIFEIPPDALVDGESRFLDWHEVELMHQEGIEIGSHGVTHEILTLNKATASQEIIHSKEIIQEKLGTEIYSFSYPNGDYDDSIIEMVKSAGYEIAFTTEDRAATFDSEKLAISRINIHEDMTGTIPMLLCRITGLW